MADAKALRPVPDLDGPSVVFGSIEHLPEYATLPEEFRRERGPFCEAVSSWFYSGAKRNGEKITIGGRTFAPKAGIDGTKALRAIKAALGSWEPKHEHKIAGCGFLLSEWFDIEAAS